MRAIPEFAIAAMAQEQDDVMTSPNIQESRTRCSSSTGGCSGNGTITASAGAGRSALLAMVCQVCGEKTKRGSSHCSQLCAGKARMAALNTAKGEKAPAPPRRPPTPPELPVCLLAHAAQWSCDVAPGPGIADRVEELAAPELGELLTLYEEVGALPEELHAAVCRGDAQRVAAVVAAVAEIKCAIDWRDANGRTAACVAAAQNNVQILALLVKHGADLRARDLDGRTLLHSAVGGNAVDCARILIRLQADTQAADYLTGATPLHIAAAAGLLESVHLLLSVGADCSSVDGLGCTPLHVAAKAGQAEVILELLNVDMDSLLTHDAKGRSARACAVAQPRDTVEQKLVVAVLDIFSAWPAIARQPLLVELRGTFPRATRSSLMLLKQVRQIAANPSALTLGLEETKELVQPCPRYTLRSKRTQRKAPIEPLSGRNTQSGQRRARSNRRPSDSKCRTQQSPTLFTPLSRIPRNLLCTEGFAVSSPPDDAPSSPEVVDDIAQSKSAITFSTTECEENLLYAKHATAEAAAKQEREVKPTPSARKGKSNHHDR